MASEFQSLANKLYWQRIARARARSPEERMKAGPELFDYACSITLTALRLIVAKLRWARGKDRDDVRDVIAMQGGATLDWDYIHHWTGQHGSRAQLDAIRASIPPLD